MPKQSGNGLGRFLHPSPHAATAHGVTIGTPRLYEVASALLGLRRRAVYRRLIEAAPVQPGDRVLDIGCGPGFFTRLLAEAVGPGGTVVGVDAAPEMVAYADRRARGLGNCRFQVGAAESLPFEPASFDVVVSSLMVHHLPDAERPRAFQEMRRVLTPGGRVLVADVRVPGQGHGWRLVLALSGLSGMARHAPALEPLAAAAGFREIRLGDASRWLRYVRAAAA